MTIIKGLLSPSLDLFNDDYQNDIFTNYTSWISRYGVKLSNIDDAIEFLMYHEGLYSGNIMALKKLVKE